MMHLANAYHKIFLLVLVASLLALPLIAQAAEDGDPDGTQLKSLLTKPETPKDLKSMLLTGDMSSGDAFLLCAFEVISGVGAGIWEYRRLHDKCDMTHSDVHKYCYRYSLHCDHYRWKSACLSEQDLCPK